MIDYLLQYALFLVEAATVVAAILVVTAGVFSLIRQAKGEAGEHLEIRKIRERYESMAEHLYENLLGKSENKARLKARKKSRKAEKKAAKAGRHKGRSRLFVLNFEGDVRATGVRDLREEISAVLQVAGKEDEVLLRLESPGGVVHGYGLAASQLSRIRERGIKLTIAVDKVAASGGYMMACVGNRIIAAPFAIIGSIGVVGQVPNFNRWLKERNVDVEMHTAGDHKRTLTFFGENTEAGREKFNEELEETHKLFKSFIGQYRTGLDVDKVATGEHWYGTRALELGLVDSLRTSDDYLLDNLETRDIFEVRRHHRKTPIEKLTDNSTRMVEKLAEWSAHMTGQSR